MKKLLATLLLGAALAAAALPVSAREADSTVTVTATGNAAAVSLNLPENTVQGVKAFQLSFEVDSDEALDASFAFDKSLPGTVQEYRYDASAGRLNIYVAGRDDVLPGGSTSLGQVRLTGGTGTATVRVVADSLQLVDGAQGKTEIEAASNGEISLDLNDKATPAPQNTAKPSAPSETAAPSADSGSEPQHTDTPRDTTATAASPSPSALPVVTPSAGQPSTVPGGSGSKKPSVSGNAASDGENVLFTETTPEPETTAQATATPKPSATPENAADEAGEKTSSGLPLVPILVIVGLAVVAAVVVLVIRRRR